MRFVYNSAVWDLARIRVTSKRKVSISDGSSGKISSFERARALRSRARASTSIARFFKLERRALSVEHRAFTIVRKGAFSSQCETWNMFNFQERNTEKPSLQNNFQGMGTGIKFVEKMGNFSIFFLDFSIFSLIFSNFFLDFSKSQKVEHQSKTRASSSIARIFNLEHRAFRFT